MDNTERLVVHAPFPPPLTTPCTVPQQFEPPSFFSTIADQMRNSHPHSKRGCRARKDRDCGHGIIRLELAVSRNHAICVITCADSESRCRFSISHPASRQTPQYPRVPHAFSCCQKAYHGPSQDELDKKSHAKMPEDSDDEARTIRYALHFVCTCNSVHVPW